MIIIISIQSFSISTSWCCTVTVSLKITDVVVVTVLLLC